MDQLTQEQIETADKLLELLKELQPITRFQYPVLWSMYNQLERILYSDGG